MLQHLRHLVFHAEPNAFEVDITDLVPVLLAHFVHGPAFKCAGVVKGAVETAVPFDDVLYQILDLASLSHVVLHEFGLAACSADLLNDRFALVLSARRDYHGGPVLRQGHRGGAADAGVAAGDQGDFPCKRRFHTKPLCFCEKRDVRMIFRAGDCVKPA